MLSVRLGLLLFAIQVVQSQNADNPRCARYKHLPEAASYGCKMTDTQYARWLGATLPSAPSPVLNRYRRAEPDAVEENIRQLQVEALYCNSKSEIVPIPAPPDCRVIHDDSDENMEPIEVSILRMNPRLPSAMAVRCTTTYFKNTCASMTFGNTHKWHEAHPVDIKAEHLTELKSKISEIRKSGRPLNDEKLIIGEEKAGECYWLTTKEVESYQTVCTPVQAVYSKDKSNKIGVFLGKDFRSGREGEWLQDAQTFWTWWPSAFTLKSYCSLEVVTRDACILANPKEEKSAVITCSHIGATFVMKDSKLIVPNAEFDDRSCYTSAILIQLSNGIIISIPQQFMKFTGKMQTVEGRSINSALSLSSAQTEFATNSLANLTQHNLVAAAMEVCRNSRNLWEQAVTDLKNFPSRAAGILLHDTNVVALYKQGALVVKRCIITDFTVKIKPNECGDEWEAVSPHEGILTGVRNFYVDRSPGKSACTGGYRYLYKNRTHVYQISDKPSATLIARQPTYVSAPIHWEPSALQPADLYKLSEFQEDQIARSMASTIQIMVQDALKSQNHQPDVERASVIHDISSFFHGFTGWLSNLGTGIFILGIGIIVLYLFSCCCCPLITKKGPSFRRAHYTRGTDSVVIG